MGRKEMPSIKVLNIGLVLMCIVLTAFICTFLAISSNDAALDDTKESRDTSVDSCFKTGEESVQNRTSEFLDLVLKNVIGYLDQRVLRPLETEIKEWADELQSYPWDTVKRWEWHNKARYYWAFINLREAGLTYGGFALRNELLLYYAEYMDTVMRGPDEYHYLELNVNFGADHPWGGKGRSFTSAIIHPTGQSTVSNPLSEVHMNRSTCQRSGLATNGSTPDEACFMTDFSERGIHRWGRLMPPGFILWSPPYTSGVYSTVDLTAPVYHNWVYSGVVTYSLELERVKLFLQQMNIGGPVDGHPSRSRIFINIRSHFVFPEAAGRLVSSSHGNVISPTADLMLPQNSTDSIIRNTALYTEANQIDLDELFLSERVTELNISTDLAPEGERFFYRVGRLTYSNETLDWYLHVVMDRAYILGSIDKKTAETKDTISAAEKKVDDDLNSARAVLYSSVAAIAVGLTVVSVVFVLRVIRPLEALQQEMSFVAVMRLEEVDTKKPLSSLQEVRLMQISFLQVMRNLAEYRNYMPASVFHESEEDNVSELTLSCSKKSTEIPSTVDANQRCAGQLESTEAKKKKVTLASCNILSFLNSADSEMQVLRIITDYLTMTLAQVRRTKGIPDSFSGDRLYVSWNGARICPSHRTAAYNCARGITADTSLGKRFSIGIVSGEVRCGNMGCDGMKKYTFVGSLSSWVHIVERVGRACGADIAIDSIVREEVATVAFTRSLQHVQYEKHSSKTLVVHEAMHEKEVKEEEWMYQLAEGDSKDINLMYNTSYELFMKGNVEGAVKALEEFPDDGSEVMKRFRRKLSSAALDVTLCNPLGVDGLIFA